MRRSSLPLRLAFALTLCLALAASVVVAPADAQSRGDYVCDVICDPYCPYGQWCYGDTGITTCDVWCADNQAAVAVQETVDPFAAPEQCSDAPADPAPAPAVLPF